MLFLFPLLAFCHAGRLESGMTEYHDGIQLWVSFLGRASQSITLWQFGTNRLLTGQITLPLLPTGTAADGLSTTYLYEVADAIVTAFDEGGTPVADLTNPGEWPPCPLS